LATRIYLPNTGAAVINPTFGTWTETTGADRIQAVTTRISSVMTNKVQAHAATAANSTFLSRQYVIGPLAGQTYAASTIKGTIRVLESAANDNLDAMRLLVRVVAPDATNFRGTIYGPTNGTVLEFNTTLRAKRLATGGATTQVVITEGDYLVIDIGTTNTTIGVSLSDTISYGDDSATDLGDNETDTTALNPFIELAANLIFLSRGFGQANAKIKAFGVNGFGQTQADIKAVSWGFGQAQVDIKAVGRGFGQANADIKAVGNGLGQAQADIKATSNGFGQAQADINAVSSRFGQAQSDIKQTYWVYGQSQADIKAVGNGLGQVNADIVATSNAFSQANAFIAYTPITDAFTRTVANGWGTADNGGTWVKNGAGALSTYSVDGSKGVFATDAFSFWGMKLVQVDAYNADTTVKWEVSTAPAVSNSQQVWVSHRTDHAELRIITRPTGIELSLTENFGTQIGAVFDTGVANLANEQWYARYRSISTSSNTTHYAKVWKVGNTEPDWQIIRTSSVVPSDSFRSFSLQTLSNAGAVFSFDDLNSVEAYFQGFGQAQAKIAGAVSTVAVGQSQADIKQTYNQFAQAQADIKQTYSGLGQAQANIKQTYQGYGQSQADIKAVGNGLGQANADIKAIGNGVGQTQSDIKAISNGFAQSQADIKATTSQFAQSQADIKATSQGYGQSQADIKAISNQYAQAQADILATSRSYGQVQADIKAVTYQSAQAQAKINAFGVCGFAQAQADIKATSRGYGQSNALISTLRTGSGQAQADIRASLQRYGQAQSDIRTINYVVAQSQAFVVKTRNTFGQAAGLINGNFFTPVYDTFNRVVPLGLGNATNGATWVQTNGDSINASVNGSYGIITTDVVPQIWELQRSLVTGGYEISIIANFDTPATVNHIFEIGLVSNVTPVNIADSGLQITRFTDGTIFWGAVVNGEGDALQFAYTLGEFIVFKAQFIPSSSGTTITKFKWWKSGDSEPSSWMHTRVILDRLAPAGHVKLYVSAANTDVGVWGFFDLNITSAAPVGLAQAQASIVGQSFGFGQAAARIGSGGPFYWLKDTFTRILTDDLGTPDIGPEYSDVSGSGFVVDGNKLIGNSSDTFGLGNGVISAHSLINVYDADVSIEFTMPSASDPWVYTYVSLYTRDYASDHGNDVYDFGYVRTVLSPVNDLTSFRLQLEATETIGNVEITNNSGILSNITLTLDTTYILLLRAYGSFIATKIWEKNTPEPDWAVVIDGPSVHGGAVQLQAQVENDGVDQQLYVDNFNVVEVVIVGTGQAQALITHQTFTQVAGQAQAYITSSHFLKSITVSDRESMGLALADREQEVVTLSNTAGISLTLSDKNYT
jgi:hypothetical protein